MNKAKLIKLSKLLREPNADVIPDGYFSREQLQNIYKETKENTCKIIRKFMSKNPDKITMKKFRVKNVSGTISIIPYYKFNHEKKQ